MGTLRSRGEEKKSLLKPHLCQCQLIYGLSLYRNGAEGVLPIIHQPSTAALLLLIKLCFKMACLLGIAQASLALLSLRCAIARPKIELFNSVKWCESSENALFIEKS